MPPNPTAPASSVSQTCGLAKAVSSRRPVASGSPGQRRHERQDHRDGGQRQHGHGPVRRAPAELLAQPGRRGDAHDVRDREAEHDQRDGAALALRRRHARGHQGGDAEVRAVRQSVEEPGEHEQVEVGGQRAGGVEDGVRQHQGDEQPATGPPGPEEGQHRGAHHHAHGVRRDDVAGGRDRGPDPAGDLRQQAHGHELGGADREAAQGEGEHGEREVPGGGLRARGGGRGVGGSGRRHARAFLARDRPVGSCGALTAYAAGSTEVDQRSTRPNGPPPVPYSVNPPDASVVPLTPSGRRCAREDRRVGADVRAGRRVGADGRGRRRRRCVGGPDRARGAR